METQINLIDLQSEELRITSEISKLNEKLNAIKLVLRLYTNQPYSDLHSNGGIIKPIKPEDKPPLYNGKEPQTQEEMVYAVLSSLGSAMVKDVANRLFHFFPESFDESRAFKVASYQLSTLKKEGKIKGKKVFGKNSIVYSLLSEEEKKEGDLWASL